MDKFKKSGENVVTFIIDSLKGKNSVEYVNGKLPIMPEMRNLNPSTTVESPVLQTKVSENILQNVMKFLALLLILFIIYKLLQTRPDIMSKIKSIFVNVEEKIKSIKIPNPLFDASNNLNSNQILDFLLGMKKEESSEKWCFVGESKGKRYCALLEGNQCMSGNIFPSKNLCVNPKLKI